MLLITILFPILAGVGVSLPKLERRTRNLCYAAALLEWKKDEPSYARKTADR